MNTQKLKNLLKDPKTNWKYIVVVAILAFIAGAVIMNYLSKQGFEIPQITFPKRIDETADWKTYRNEGYGFEVKYPKIFTISEQVINVGTKELPVRLFGLSIKDRDELVFAFRTTPHSYLREGHPDIISGSEKEATVAGIKGISFYESNSKGDGPDFSITAIEKNGKIYEFGGEGEKFHQILSTFRFIK